MPSSSPHTIVIGAGLGGRTTAALLLQAGHRVSVLEAQTYPGGCAGTFSYQGYRFDAGATLAGGFQPGGPHDTLAKRLGLLWPVQSVNPAWVVHLPDGRQVTQWADPVRWRGERQTNFPDAEPFWHRQEKLAALAWDVAQRHFPWPPANPHDLTAVLRALRPQTLGAAPHLLRRVADLLPAGNPLFQTFVDANLLISAQTTSEHANALYGSAALDLPRRGVMDVRGGIGQLAHTLVDWITRHGGNVEYKQRVDRIEVVGRRAVAVYTNQSGRRMRSGQRLACDYVIANLTPWGLARLLGDTVPPWLQREVAGRSPTWGAFMLYLGVEAAALPPDGVNHHQVIVDADRPLGEGNSVFITLSPTHDASRAPAGMRAVNISTHTAIEPWQQLHQQPGAQAAYDERRAHYMERLLAAAERALPGLTRAARLVLPATPITYAHWTGRPQGMVGGFPQTSLFEARGPDTGLPNVWLVGDSIFPGQSTAGVTLGGMRVARSVLDNQPRWRRRGFPTAPRPDHAATG